MHKRMLSLALVAMLSLSLLGSAQGEGKVSYRFVNKFKIINEGDRTYEFTLYDRAIVKTFTDRYQSVDLVSGQASGVDFDEDGNQITMLDFPKQLEPSKETEVEVVYSVDIGARRAPTINANAALPMDSIPEGLREEFVVPVGPWRYDNWTEIRGLASSIKGNETTVLKVVYNIVEWIGDNVQYPKDSGSGAKYPIETYRDRVGDCDDQSNLLIALCRAVGIPAYLQIGGIFMPDRGLVNSTLWDGRLIVREGKVGFHGWAIVYVPPFGWTPFDMTWGYALGKPENAVTRAALFTSSAFTLYNITRSDYVRDGRQAEEMTKRYDLLREEYYSLEVVEYPRLEMAAPLVAVSVIGIAAISLTLVMLYVKAGRRTLDEISLGKETSSKFILKRN